MHVLPIPPNNPLRQLWQFPTQKERIKEEFNLAEARV